jgi:hypothetical protein
MPKKSVTVLAVVGWLAGSFHSLPIFNISLANFHDIKYFREWKEKEYSTLMFENHSMSSNSQLNQYSK